MMELITILSIFDQNLYLARMAKKMPHPANKILNKQLDCKLSQMQLKDIRIFQLKELIKSKVLIAD